MQINLQTGDVKLSFDVPDEVALDMMHQIANQTQVTKVPEPEQAEPQPVEEQAKEETQPKPGPSLLPILQEDMNFMERYPSTGSLCTTRNHFSAKRKCSYYEGKIRLEYLVRIGLLNRVRIDGRQLGYQRVIEE